MSESYSDGEAAGGDREAALARELLARLLPGADAALLVRALLAERAESPVALPGGELSVAPDETTDDPPTRELRRVRRQFARGEAVRSAQHDLNNPLTAMLAEAQLLQLEVLGEEHRAAAGRIVTLARRIAAAARRLDGTEPSTIG